jgi:hypothetical protein
MTAAAPRIGAVLLAGIEKLDDESVPIAEVHRRVSALASHLDCTRPSYQQIRVLVHEHRQRGLAPTAGQVLLDVAFRVKPPDALLEHLAGAK